MASNFDAIILEKGPEILNEIDEKLVRPEIISAEEFDKITQISKIGSFIAQELGAKYADIVEVKLAPKLDIPISNIDEGEFFSYDRFLKLALSVDPTLSDKEILNQKPLFYEQIYVCWAHPDSVLMEEGEDWIGELEPKTFDRAKGPPFKLYTTQKTVCFCKDIEYMDSQLKDDIEEKKLRSFTEIIDLKKSQLIAEKKKNGMSFSDEEIDEQFWRSYCLINIPIVADHKGEKVTLGMFGLGDIDSWDMMPLSEEAMSMLRKIASRIAPIIAQAYQAHQWKVINGRLDRAYTDLRDAQAAIILQEKLSSLGMLSASIAHGVHNPLFALSVSTRRLEELTARLGSDWQKLESQGLSAADRHILQELLATVGHPATQPSPDQTTYRA